MMVPPSTEDLYPTEPRPLNADSTSLNDWSHLPGRLVVISGPSGSGKTTIVRRVVADRVKLSVSATTRAARPGETDGEDYFFLDRKRFAAAVEAGSMLEWAEVHGNWYGTPALPVRRSLEAGDCVLLEIDVQGGFQVLERFPATVLVFVNTPSFPILEDRLRSRSTEGEAAIVRRLDNARREIALGASYHHQIINEDLDRAIQALSDLIIRLGCGGDGNDA